ncbi:MAG: hypothetical protein ACLTSZ_08885 [Lachnospiraceae bacterium]
MRLNPVLQRLEYTCLQGQMDIEVAEIINGSRKAKEGSLFFCIRGAVTDGHKYAKEVAVRWSCAVLIVRESRSMCRSTSTVIQVA